MASLLQDGSLIATAYLVGGLPTAFLIGKWFAGVDIRLHGSRNIGALNIYRVAGARAGLLVLAIDIAKGAVMVLGAEVLGGSGAVVLASALAVAAGHNWSPYLRFRGGKGAAVVLGASFPVVPWLTAGAFLLAIIIFVLGRNAAWAFLIAATALNGSLLLTDLPPSVIATCFALFGLVILTHLGRRGPEVWSAVRAGDLRRLFALE